MNNKTLQIGNWIMPLLLSLLNLSLAGCAPTATPAAKLTEVTAQLKWLHQAETQTYK